MSDTPPVPELVTDKRLFELLNSVSATRVIAEAREPTMAAFIYAVHACLAELVARVTKTR